MSDYRYVVFPIGKQPTVDEAAELQNLSGVLSGRSAIGINRETLWLAIAFDAAAFDNAMTTHRGFAALIHKWEVRGSEVVDRIGFIKDATALRPMQPNSWTPAAGSADRGTSYGKLVASKEIAAKEAVARSSLVVQKTLARHSALQRFATLVPYLLIALVSLGVIVLGFYAGNRLLDAPIEKRRETTVRVIDDAMDQPLKRRPGRVESSAD